MGSALTGGIDHERADRVTATGTVNGDHKTGISPPRIGLKN